METRKLGPSGLEVSLVGLGTNQFGGRLDLEASRKVIHKALDLGVTHFDTADIYGNSGGSETIIGEVLGARRKEVTLATKFGKPMAGNAEDHRGSRAYVLAAVEASLKRLKTDTIDLLWMHEPDPSTPMEETFRALEELIQAGKVRHRRRLEFRGGPAHRRRGLGQGDRRGRLRRRAGRIQPALPHARDRALPGAGNARPVSLVPYFPLSGGALSGKYRKDRSFPDGTRLNEESRFVEPHWETIEKLAAFAEDARPHAARPRHELARLQAADRLDHRRRDQAGAGRSQCGRAVGWKLSDDEMAEVDRITAV